MSKDNKDPPVEMGVASEAKAAAVRRPRRLDKSIQTAIGTRLRAYYEGIEREPIPPRLLELLNMLKEKELESKMLKEKEQSGGNDR